MSAYTGDISCMEDLLNLLKYRVSSMVHKSAMKM
jgi:hypothetical protein